jgi:hypothetical protein
MKVAVFFSGRVKGFDNEQVKTHLKSFKEKYSADFYVSCGSHNESFNEFIREFVIIGSNFSEVKIPKEFYNFKKASETKIENCSSMFFHNKKCIDLIKESGIKYDIVIKYRADITSDSILDVYQLSPISENTVYIPEGNDFGGLNDQIAYGDLSSMEKYTLVFQNIPIICNDGHRFHPETLVFRNLEREKVNVARVKYSWSLVADRK